MSGSVRAMCESDLESVLEWRNHPDIRKFMYTQHKISSTEHHQWFTQSRQDGSKTLLIYESDATPLGFINLTQAKQARIADWGFYLSPFAPRGTGYELGKAALAYAFATLELHKVCGQALGFNERSIKLHLRLGFQQEGELRDQHYDGQCYHSVVHFGLLRNEWQTQP